jgi:hypothetical protein
MFMFMAMTSSALMAVYSRNVTSSGHVTHLRRTDTLQAFKKQAFLSSDAPPDAWREISIKCGK